MRSATKMVLGGLATAMLGVAGVVAVATFPEAEPVVTAPRAPVALPMPELTSTLPPSAPVAPERLPESDRGVTREVLTDEGPIRARRLVVAGGIDQREPVGASDVFDLGAFDRVYAFVEAVNETDEAVTLTVTFEPASGESTGHVALEVPARAGRFRTWAFTRNIASGGQWEAVVRGPDGDVLARRPFVVE
jgi:hypothetical protein